MIIICWILVAIQPLFYRVRSVEDLKERYYAIAGKLSQIRSPKSVGEEKVYVYDADHERRRKEQLRRLWDRTPEAIEEEQVISRSDLSVRVAGVWKECGESIIS